MERPAKSQIHSINRQITKQTNKEKNKETGNEKDSNQMSTDFRRYGQKHNTLLVASSSSLSDN